MPPSVVTLKSPRFEHAVYGDGNRKKQKEHGGHRTWMSNAAAGGMWYYADCESKKSYSKVIFLGGAEHIIRVALYTRQNATKYQARKNIKPKQGKIKTKHVHLVQ